MKTFISNITLIIIFCIFSNKIQAQDGYTYSLVDNGSFNYTIVSVPNTSTNNFATSVQSYGFTITLPDGVTATIISSLGNGAGATFFNGSDVGDNSIDGYLITETLGGPMNIAAPSSGMTTNMVTIQLNESPDSGSISILENNSSLATAVTPLKSFLTADMEDDGMAMYSNRVEENGTGVSGTSSYMFTTLSLETRELSDIELYPNPSSGQVTIDSGNKIIDSIEIYDITGRLVTKNVVNKPLYKFDVTSLDSSFYMVVIKSGKSSISKRLIKN